MIRQAKVVIGGEVGQEATFELHACCLGRIHAAEFAIQTRRAQARQPGLQFAFEFYHKIWRRLRTAALVFRGWRPGC